MKRRPWFADHAEIRRRQSDRLAGRPPLAEGGPLRFHTRTYNEFGDLVGDSAAQDQAAPPVAGTFSLGGGPPMPYTASVVPDPVEPVRPVQPVRPEEPRRSRAREWAGEVGGVAGELVGELIGWVVRRLL